MSSRVKSKEAENERKVISEYFRNLFTARTKELNKTQEEFANYLGITQGAVWQRLNGRSTIDLRFISAFVKFLNLNYKDIDPSILKLIFGYHYEDAREITTLISNESTAESQDSLDRDRFLDLSQNRTNGIPWHQIDNTLAFSEKWISNKGWPRSELVVITITGESMWPTLVSGDRVILNTRAKNLQDGLFAFRTDEEIVIRRVNRRVDNEFLIITDNPQYENYTLNALTDKVDVAGSVLWRSHLMG